METKVNLSELMVEAIQLLPYLNSNKKLHRIYKAPMLNVIKAALLTANTKLLELKAYDNIENPKSIILDTVKKEEPKEQ